MSKKKSSIFVIGYGIFKQKITGFGMFKHSCVFVDVIYRLDVNVNLPAPVSEDNVWHSERENQLPGRNMSSDPGITFCLIR